MNRNLLIGKSFSATYLAIFLLATLFAVTPAISFAQETEEPKKEFKFSDEELLKFFDANQELSVLQRETHERINEVVESNGLTMDRFNQIVRASQIGALDAGLYSEDELNAFNSTAPQVTSVQRDMQAMIQATLMEAGLTTDIYQEILGEFRANQELQEHVRELLRERARQAAREARQREREQNQEQN